MSEQTTRYAKLREPNGVEFAPANLTAEELTAGGYMPYQENPRPDGPHNYSPKHMVKSGKVVRDWKAYPNFAEIEKLKKELAETDYKVIKCYEYQLTKQEAPYDIVAVHEERELIRTRINDLKEAK